MSTLRLSLLSTLKLPPDLIRELIRNRYLIYQLAKRDFKSRYVGSSLGLLWAFLQPLAMMAILWFVFEYGLKSKHTNSDIPFAAWFFTAVIAWNFFADVLIINTGVFYEYSFMLKKVDFNQSLLPFVKIISSTIIHIIFILILIGILLAHNILPTWHWLQLPYYTFATIYFLVGVSWLTASLNLFLKDTAQIVNIVSQFGFWLTPILWNINAIPKDLHFYVKLNPMYYITEGYRNCLIYQTPLSDLDPKTTCYFWGISTVTLLLGAFVFNKLRPHFADVI